MSLPKQPRHSLSLPPKALIIEDFMLSRFGFSPSNVISTKAKVVLDYEPSGVDELQVKKGQIVTVVTQHGLSAEDQDWWKIENHGRVGFVPPSHLKIIDPSKPQEGEEEEEKEEVLIEVIFS